MPNWCSNHLTIEGDSKQLKEFLEKSITDVAEEEEIFTFSGTYPEPDYDTTPVARTYPEISATYKKGKEKEEILKNEPTIRKGSWWDWRVQNWGTKWEPSDVVIYTQTKNILEISFETAWSPPIEWLEKVHQDFPDLIFDLEYEESGMGFGGHAHVHGKISIFEDQTWNLDYGSDCCKSPMKEDEDGCHEEPYICSKCGDECEGINYKKIENV
jgi:hypothetical protein